MACRALAGAVLSSAADCRGARDMYIYIYIYTYLYIYIYVYICIQTWLEMV